jgi:hypothetical protein
MTQVQAELTDVKQLPNDLVDFTCIIIRDVAKVKFCCCPIMEDRSCFLSSHRNLINLWVTNHYSYFQLQCPMDSLCRRSWKH